MLHNNPDDKALDQDYWNTRWENQTTGWDIGYASPAIVDYMKTCQSKDAAILIPGCGNAYEAEAMLKLGFTNITLLDIAPKSVEILQNKFKDLAYITVIGGDFFQHQASYDLIIEQTFFCAIAPIKRSDYAKKMQEILKVNGKLVGLLFDRKFEQQGPPFGGSPSEYRSIFKDYLEIIKMEQSTNSIAPRAKQELWIEMRK